MNAELAGRVMWKRRFAMHIRNWIQWSDRGEHEAACRALEAAGNAVGAYHAWTGEAWPLAYGRELAAEAEARGRALGTERTVEQRCAERILALAVLRLRAPSYLFRGGSMDLRDARRIAGELLDRGDERAA